MTGKVRDVLSKLNVILNRSQKRYGIIVLFCSFVGAALETVGVSVIGPLVTLLLNPEELMAVGFIQELSGVLGIREYGKLVLLIGGGVIVLYIVKNGFFIFLSWIRAKYACKLNREISVEMMDSYMKRGYAFFTRHNTGELLNGVASDVGSVYLIIANGLKIVVDIMTIVLICLFMLAKDVQLALVVMILALACFGLIIKVFRKAMLRSGDLYRKYNARSHQALLHAFEGIKDVIILDKRDFFVKEYNDNWSKQQRENVGRTVAGESPAYIIEGVCVSGLLLVICMQAMTSENPAGMVATLASFAIGAFRVLPSLGRISNSMNTVLYSVKGLDSVYHNITEARRYEQEYSVCVESGEEKEETTIVFKESLEIKKLSFAYDNQQEDVIRHLDMSIPKGQSVAFIGHSGAGKTTLADIILGLLLPREGGVFLDGQNIQSLGTGWRKVIGYVPQSVYLADNTIRFNVAFGENRGQVDDALVWKALEQAQLKEFVEGLPEGLDTYVGDRGIRFSGGQRQRMAIARALYYEPQILVLDEATAALDTETEQAVMQSIEALQGKITMIIVAHRLTTIRNCDVIYEIKEGGAVVRDKEDLF